MIKNLDWLICIYSSVTKMQIWLRTKYHFNPLKLYHFSSVPSSLLHPLIQTADYYHHHHSSATKQHRTVITTVLFSSIRTNTTNQHHRSLYCTVTNQQYHKPTTKITLIIQYQNHKPSFPIFRQTHTTPMITHHHLPHQRNTTTIPATSPPNPAQPSIIATIPP